MGGVRIGQWTETVREAVLGNHHPCQDTRAETHQCHQNTCQQTVILRRFIYKDGEKGNQRGFDKMQNKVVTHLKTFLKTFDRNFVM